MKLMKNTSYIVTAILPPSHRMPATFVQTNRLLIHPRRQHAIIPEEEEEPLYACRVPAMDFGTMAVSQVVIAEEGSDGGSSESSSDDSSDSGDDGSGPDSDDYSEDSNP
jgi:hypothetical protein